MEKNFQSVPIEFKFLSTENNLGTFEGYGSVFGNVDSTNDIVAKGAFLDSLQKNGNPSMLYQHDARRVMGVWDMVKEDQNGLYVKGTLNLEVQDGREAYALIKQGAIKGLSIGYRVKQAAYDEKTGVRTIKQADVLEVSLVTFPANAEAQVTAVKSLPKTIREYEQILRAAGFGQTQAKALVSGGWKAYAAMQRDAESDDVSDDVQRDADDLKVVVNNFNSILKAIKGDSECRTNPKK